MVRFSKIHLPRIVALQTAVVVKPNGKVKPLGAFFYNWRKVPMEYFVDGTKADFIALDRCISSGFTPRQLRFYPLLELRDMVKASGIPSHIIHRSDVLNYPLNSGNHEIQAFIDWLQNDI